MRLACQQLLKNHCPILLPPSSPVPTLQEYTKALEFCDKALALDAANAKATLRRVRAMIGRHEYDAAEAGVARVEATPGLAHEAHQLRVDLDRARQRGAASEKAAFASMFQGPRALQPVA